MAFPTTKPTIASPGFEFDSRTLQFANGGTVAVWEDQSGQGKDATGVNSPEYDTSGWPRGAIPSVRLKETDFDHFTFDGGDFVGTDFTLFLVIEATDIALSPSLAGMAILGGSTTSRDLGMLQVGIVGSTGAVVFALFDTSGGQNDITSASGLVVNGDLCIITCRHSSAIGKILRLNGEQIGSTSATDHLASWDDPYIGRIQAFYGIDKRFVWLAGYKVAATDKQIDDMECYLSGLFGVYVASCLPPDPAIFNVELNTTISTDLELPQSVSMILQLEGTITEDVDA